MTVVPSFALSSHRVSEGVDFRATAIGRHWQKVLAVRRSLFLGMQLILDWRRGCGPSGYDGLAFGCPIVDDSLSWGHH